MPKTVNLTMLGALVLSALTSLATPIVSAQSFSLSQTFFDPTVTSGDDKFGESVAIDGNHVLIGAYGDNTNGSAAGQSHLFDATTGNLLKTFNAPTATAGDSFGFSVAISGNHVLIGTPGDETNGRNVGQAHLFDITTGSLLHTFNDPTVTSSDGFGVSVAIDDNHVLIGASGDDTNGSNGGQAYLFDVATGSLLQTFNDPTTTTKDEFGVSVAIDDNHVLIGAFRDETNGHDVGQAHLFDVTSGSLLRTFNDPTVTSTDWFGFSVAIDGNHALIGAPLDDTNGENVGQAHLYDVTTGNLLQTFNDSAAINKEFGHSVAIDQNHVLIGAAGTNTSGGGVGQAHLFDATTGSLLQTFNDPMASISDLFGISVAIDGNRVLVGDSGDDTNGFNVGQAHLFVPEPGSLTLAALGLMSLGVTSCQRIRHA